MAKTISAGLLMYKIEKGGPLVFLGHAGGPFYAKKDAGAWDIPKGEINPDENFFDAAKREFVEETGFPVPDTQFLALTPIKRKDGKMVHIWAFKGDCDPSKLKSNMCTMEWPPKSGKQIEIPEIDKGQFFSINDAKIKIYSYFLPMIEEFEKKLTN